MKLDIQIEKTIRGAQHHHHPSLKRRRALPSLGWEKWTTFASRSFFSGAHGTEHQSGCGAAVFGYSDELLDLFKRAAKASASISIDPDVMEGQPCISGTRIPVRAVLRAIEHYGSLDDVIMCYPHLTKDQVKDALYFAQVLLEPQSGLDEAPTAA
jgi:uncharacterized protein (DUF433 family)